MGPLTTQTLCNNERLAHVFLYIWFYVLEFAAKSSPSFFSQTDLFLFCSFFWVTDNAQLVLVGFASALCWYCAYVVVVVGVADAGIAGMGGVAPFVWRPLNVIGNVNRWNYSNLPRTCTYPLITASAYASCDADSVERIVPDSRTARLGSTLRGHVDRIGMGRWCCCCCCYCSPSLSQFKNSGLWKEAFKHTLHDKLICVMEFNFRRWPSGTGDINASILRMYIILIMCLSSRVYAFRCEWTSGCVGHSPGDVCVCVWVSAAKRATCWLHTQ